MNLRPLLGNFTDPQYKLSRAAQKKLTLKAHHEYLSQWTLWLFTIGLVIVGIPGFGLVQPLMMQLLSSWGVTGNAWPGMSWAWLIAAIVFIGFVWVGSAWAYRFIYIRPIRRAMLDEGYDVCLNCGYDQQGLPKDRIVCPECGGEREQAPERKSDGGSP